MTHDEMAILRTEIKEIKDSLDSYHKKTEPMLEWFANITWGKNVTIGILKVAGAVIGVILGTAAIYKMLK